MYLQKLSPAACSVLTWVVNFLPMINILQVTKPDYLIVHPVCRHKGCISYTMCLIQGNTDISACNTQS